MNVNKKKTNNIKVQPPTKKYNNITINPYPIGIKKRDKRKVQIDKRIK